MNGPIDALADKLGTPYDATRYCSPARELSRKVIHACAGANQIEGILLVQVGMLAGDTPWPQPVALQEHGITLRGQDS